MDNERDDPLSEAEKSAGYTADGRPLEEPTNVHPLPVPFRRPAAPQPRAAGPEVLAGHAGGAIGGAAPRVSARDRLLAVAASDTVWRTPDGEACATALVDGHVEHWPVRGRGYRELLLRSFGETYKVEVDGREQPAAANRQAVADALDHVEARAIGPGVPVHEPALRSAAHEGGFFIDRGTDDWSVLAVTAGGVEVRTSAPVPILRTRRTRPLPTPEPDGSVDSLRELLPSLATDGFRLTVLWMLAALQPRGPYPILVLNGEQGSGKTTLSRALRRLTDPAGGHVLQPPASTRDLIAAARHNRVLAFDNLCGLSADLADAFCRLATGAEIGGRGMYTDFDVATFTATRPILINGIPDLAARPDLASRSLVVELAPLSATSSEAEFWQRFDAVAGRVMGALLHGLSTALRTLPTTPTPQGLRMADFARLAQAAAPAFGWDSDELVDLLRANADAQVASQIDADLVAEAVLRLVERDGGFHGLATVLHQRLTSLVGEAVARQPAWPKLPHFLVGNLKRAAPTLRRAGVEVARKRTKRGSWLSIAVHRGEPASPASPAPPASPPGGASVAPAGVTLAAGGDTGDARAGGGLDPGRARATKAGGDDAEEFRL